MKRDVAAVAIAGAAQLEVEVIVRAMDNLKKSYETAVRRLEEQLRDADALYADYLGGEHYTEALAAELGDELAMIALFRVVELNTLKALRFRYKNKAKDLYRFDTLGPKLKTDLNLELSSLSGFTAVNEIRLINNAIKHENKVTTMLAKAYPAWTEGDELCGLDAAFKRLSPDVSNYLNAFAYAVIP
jgi:hypothetical protein